jgi:aspartyl-tRNA(Asn)/glutamyl-tRNA(Gln) amidotransferase subunit A
MVTLHSATLLEQLAALRQGQITSQELVQDTVRYLKDVNQRFNYVVTLTHQESVNPQGALGGVPYALKDIFSTRGIKTTASSNILSDYVPVFDSTVYTKLKNAGAVMIAKSNLDELAMGGTGMNTAHGPALNPYDPLRMTGGSSGGSAGLVASGVVPFAMGSDTGDSVRKPAAFCGIVGIKPTWGASSRYG